MMTRLSDRLWQLDDGDGCTGYLLVGRERAYMIDCGLGREAVRPQIRRATELPVELLLTHAHPDHCGAAEEFDAVWLPEREQPYLERAETMFAAFGVAPLRRDALRLFGAGRTFDAGGLTVRALPLEGHTPGSTVFACPEEHTLLTGDALGSGDIVLMAVPGALTARAYLSALRRFAREAAPYGDALWHGGHAYQSGRPGTAGYHPPCLALTRDMIALCEGLLAGRVAGRPVQEPNAPGGTAFRADLGRAGIVYDAAFLG